MVKKLLFKGDGIDAENHIKNCKVKNCGTCKTLRYFLKRIDEDNEEELGNVFLEDAEEFTKQSKIYREVLEHRRNCKKWGKKFCLECFGGGLTKFTMDLESEYRKESKR